LRQTVLVPDTPVPLLATLAAEAHLVEGKFLLEEQILNMEQLNKNKQYSEAITYK
jgi:hypothetical protein